VLRRRVIFWDFFRKKNASHEAGSIYKEKFGAHLEMKLFFLHFCKFLIESLKSRRCVLTIEMSVQHRRLHRSEVSGNWHGRCRLWGLY
jgi:hypothetical protein